MVISTTIGQVFTCDDTDYLVHHKLGTSEKDIFSQWINRSLNSSFSPDGLFDRVTADKWLWLPTCQSGFSFMSAIYFSEPSLEN